MLPVAGQCQVSTVIASLATSLELSRGRRTDWCRPDFSTSHSSQYRRGVTCARHKHTIIIHNWTAQNQPLLDISKCQGVSTHTHSILLLDKRFTPTRTHHMLTESAQEHVCSLTHTPKQHQCGACTHTHTHTSLEEHTCTDASYPRISWHKMSTISILKVSAAHSLEPDIVSLFIICWSEWQTHFLPSFGSKCNI